MSSITSKLASSIQNEIEASIKQVLAKHNIHLAKNSATYTESDMRITLDLKVMSVSEDGRAIPKLALTFLKAHGIDPDREYTIDNKKFKIVDYVRRNHKNPIIVEDVNGKRYKTTVSSILKASN